ncbi:Formate dehydrogenase [Thermosinus carboxydivorans Nor1]|uniref:Formate dehydrogenase n=1 Tax=Thermosinus carboxydivorans Nor1 TaxID=401526 RepID=A1HLY6_9FIRM|nr:molybdopterin-dependent oxidoreductase [Thermosinus carboxydivorans]EAX48838.1 Formate dehydrogenase [Thermosinus carboxydivorans Nor1]
MWAKRFTRRTFLKAAATTAAVLGAGGTFSFGDWLKTASAATVTKVPSICETCSAACGLWVHVKNGRIWKVSGQKDHPASKGRLCARGHAGMLLAYHKDRITHPMKRMGENWYVPITWEQAYTEIAAKLKQVLAEHGPEKFFISHNPRPTGKFYLDRFLAAVGSSTLQSHHSMCSTARDVAYKWTTGGMATADIGKTKYIVFLGRNYAEGLSPSSVANLVAAHERGAKIIIVDPRHNASCLFGQWVPIRPGTDLALLLAIAHVLIKEDLYDKDFVTNYCVGFDEFKQAMAPYTPEWAAAITDIPAATIYEIARGLGQNRPASCIEQGYKAPNGTNYANGTQMFRALACVNALLGNYGQDGGMKFPVGPKLGSLDPKKYPAPPKAKVPRCDGVGIKGEFPLCQPSQGIVHLMPKMAMEGRAKAGFLHRINPVRNAPDPEFMMKGYKQLDLMVVCDVKWSETAMCAHYVLPECSPAEREDLPDGLSGSRPAVTMRSQAIDVIHPETKHLADIITELASYMGLEKYFNFTREEVAAAMVKPLGITLDDLRAKGTIGLPGGQKPGVPEFKTETKKVELYCKAFADNGFDPLPKWQPPLTKADKNTFVLIHGKQAFMSHTATASDPYLLAIARKYDLERIWINADRAKKLGIKDGDLVEVSSPLATRRVRAKVTERIHPDAAYLPAGYGRFAPFLKIGRGFGVNPNDFVPFRTEPISGHAMMMEVAVHIRKAGE